MLKQKKKKLIEPDIPDCIPENCISLETFAKQCDKSPSTVRKRAPEIPGSVMTSDGYVFLDGTRYPIRRNFKPDSSGKRRYFLIKAISTGQYISENELLMSKADFQRMLTELEEVRLIAKNNKPNQFGANGYDCTISGDEHLLKYLKDYDPKKSEKLEAAIHGIINGTIQAAIPEIFKMLFSTGAA